MYKEIFINSRRKIKNMTMKCPNCGEEVHVTHRCSECGREGCFFCHFDNRCEKCGSSREYCLDCLILDYGTKYCKYHYRELHKKSQATSVLSAEVEEQH